MTKTKKSIAFIAVIAVVCLAFGLFVWQANRPSGESALAASTDRILTLQIGNPQMTVDGENVNIDDGASLVNRIESRNGLHTLEHAAEIGLGSREYNLVSIDS